MKNIRLLLLAFLIGCGGNRTAEEKENAVIESQWTKPPDGEVLLMPGHTVKFMLTLDDRSDRVELAFDIPKGDSLFGELTSEDKKANIRFTQLQMPDESFDGPFDKELKYAIKQHGRYHIIIGQNMMAGDPWTGDFYLRMWTR